MKNIWTIFRYDLKSIARNMIAFIVIIGISILPALYSWFNIAANWDPYSSTGGISFAVCSEDKGYHYKSLEINAGDEIISNLKQNDKMGWHFVNKKEALDGVKSGEYYAAVIITEDFSENLCSVTTGKFEQAKLQYYVNEKKNAIAPKMTNAGVQTIQNQIASTYVETITKVIATTLNLTQDTLSGDKITTANKIIDALGDLDDEIDTFNAGVDVFVTTIDSLETLVKTNKDILPDLEDTLAQSGVITSDVKNAIDSTRTASKHTTDTIADMIDSMGATQNNISSQLDTLFNSFSGDMSGAAEELKNAAESVTLINSANDKLMAVLTAIDDTEIDASDAIDALNTLKEHQSQLNDKLNAAAKQLDETGSLPKEVIDEINTLIDSCEKDMAALNSSFETIKTGLTNIFGLAAKTQSEMDAKVSEAFAQLSVNANAAAEQLSSLTAFPQRIISVNNSVINLLKLVQTATGTDHSALIKQLQTINQNQQQIIDKINAACAVIQKTGSLPQKTQDEIKALISSAADDINAVSSALTEAKGTISKILSDFVTEQKNLTARLSAAADALSGDMASAAEQLKGLTEINNKLISVNNAVTSFLNDTQDNFDVDNSDVINKLKTINSHTDEVSQKLTQVANTVEQTGRFPSEMRDEIKKLTGNLAKEISSLKTSFTAAKKSIDKAVDSVYNTLEKASGLLKSVDGGVPDLDKTLDSTVKSLEQVKKTFTNIKTLMSKYRDKISDLKDRIADLRDNDTIENYVSTIIERPDALGNFVANPVQLETNEVYKTDNYGSAMTPFYTTLGFWVGSVVLVAVLRTNLKKRELKRLEQPTSTQMFFGRFMIYFMLSQIQSLIIALGDVFFLRIQCENIPLFIVSAMISAAVYVLITYSLTITFSVIGKALSVIILVIQVAGSGGTFPIEVLPSTFQAIAPYLPFKYSINMMREAICGVDAGSYVINLLCLLAFVPFALLLGLLLRKPCIKLMSFFNDRLEQSDLVV